MKPRILFLLLAVIIIMLLVLGNISDWQKVPNPPAADTAAMPTIVDTINHHGKFYRELSEEDR